MTKIEPPSLWWRLRRNLRLMPWGLILLIILQSAILGSVIYGGE